MTKPLPVFESFSPRSQSSRDRGKEIRLRSPSSRDMQLSTDSTANETGFSRLKSEEVPASSRLSGTKIAFLFLLVFILTVDSLGTLFLFKSSSMNKIVWSSAWITCVTTGLGAFPFFFIDSLTKYTISMSNAVAAGMMITASIQLFAEGYTENGCMQSLFIGACLGLLLMIVTEKLDFDFANEVLSVKKQNSKRLFLILAAMTFHSFAEGVGLGVSFHSDSLGTFITTTLAIHNIPEGLALAVVLIPSGISVPLAILLCIFSSLPQPLMSVPAYTFVSFFSSVLPYGLGFAGGAMLYVAVFELFLEAVRDIGFVRTLCISMVFSGLMYSVSR